MVKTGLEPATPGSSILRSTNWSNFTVLAAFAGLEPTPTESNSDVLPLDEKAVWYALVDLNHGLPAYETGALAN